MTYSLYIDDERTPKTSPPVGDEWVICRNEEAVKQVVRKGWPAYVSFDHDLGEDEPTGYSVAKTMVYWHMYDPVYSKLPFPEVNVHSANPVGRDNIQFYINNYLKHLK